MKSFTLIELLIVVSVMLILSSLLSPTFTKVVENAQTTQCKVNFKGIFNAIMIYTNDFDNYLPGPSGERGGPHYRKVIKYNRAGELRRRNKRFASYLHPYMETKVYDDVLDYIPGMICPSNEDMADLLGDPRVRAQYNILNPDGVNKPFGDHSRTNIHGVFIEEKMPKQITAVQNPSDANALKDVRDPNKRYESIPDLPVHQDFRENVLFFDGSVETREVF